MEFRYGECAILILNHPSPFYFEIVPPMRTFLRTLMSSFGLSIAASLLWVVVQLSATSWVDDASHQETIGLLGFVTSWVIAGIAFIHGGILGAVSAKGRLLRLFLWHLLVYLLLAVVWSIYMVRAGATPGRSSQPPISSIGL
jgi:hypothetical protein